MPREHIHFVTGRLAEHSLRRVLEDLAPKAGFDYSVDVLNITVAALIAPAWALKRIQVPPGATRVMLPGYCEGDLAPLEAAFGVPVERGPRDLRNLPDYFGQAKPRDDYGAYDIEILAEINHAPRWELAGLLAEADRLRADGANVIDVGCNPGEIWSGVGEAVRALRDAGHRVSIDSLEPAEIAPAVEAGAELVLSVNATNRDAAADWGCECVVIPDAPETLGGLDETVEQLAAAGVPLRIDAVLEPIGLGVAASLGRYLEVRRRYPDAEMLMGVGNITELTDVDSAGLNVLLLGFCQEVGIRSVLTTEVINWAQSSVRECDLARRLIHYAHRHQTLPKRLEPNLVMLRDPKVTEPSGKELDELAARIKDNNYRLFAADERIHLVSSQLHLQDDDPFRLFEQLLATNPKNMDPGHAFYLGYEMCKALTALTLGKQYQQDEALRWGLLTRDEKFHRLKRGKSK
jgi:dihydropteroate synthase-like protein